MEGGTGDPVGFQSNAQWRIRIASGQWDPGGSVQLLRAIVREGGRSTAGGGDGNNGTAEHDSAPVRGRCAVVLAAGVALAAGLACWRGPLRL